MKPTDNEIIDSIGGTRAVAELCEIEDSSISQWRKRGIPRSRRLFLEVVRPDAFVPTAAAATEDASH